MVRRSLPLLVKRLASATLITLAIGATINCAGAASRRDRQDDQDSEISQGTIAGPPVMAIVSLKDQRVSLYDANGGAMHARVSTGRTDYETPVGIYSVLEKEEEHYSNVYDDASMPFMQRLTWSGLSLHAGVLPGYPASHGCVRMPNGFAEQIFPLTKIGMRVIVAHDDIAPVAVSHPLLAKLSPAVSSASATAASYDAQGADPENGSPFQPDVHNWPAQQARFDAVKAVAAEKAAEAAAATAHADELKRAAAKKLSERGKAARALRIAEFAKRDADEDVNEADHAIAAAKSPAATTRWEAAKGKALSALSAADAKLALATAALQTADDELTRAKQETAPAESARVAAVNAAKDAQHKTVPVSLFISLKTQRLYVRQGHEPVFDAPVTIAEPEKPIGTHVYTAVDYVNEGKDVRWTVVSLERRTPDDTEDDDPYRKRHRSESPAEPMPTDLPSANAALDRVTLPPDVLARVSESVWPGSSLIVSDEEMSKETGNATDFIVLISGEPQGGLKKRPHQGPSADFYRYEADDYYYGDDRYRRRRYRGGGFFNFWQ